MDTQDKEPETMEALLAQQATVTEKLATKHVAWVKVISVTKDAVLVDIGEKREGVVPLSEFVPLEEKKGGDEAAAETKAPAAPAVGQRVPVILIGPRRDGTTLLSHKKARAELGWEAAVKAFKDHQRLRGTIVQSIKGGYLVDCNGVNGFLPASLADLRPVRNPARMVHTGVRCYIIELNESKKQIVLSRKAVLEEETHKRRAKLLADLRLGEVKIGRVVHSGAAGLVVDIGGLEGVVRAADLSWGGSAKTAGYERGAKVRVKVLSKPAAPTGGSPSSQLPSAETPAAGGAAAAEASAKPEAKNAKPAPPKSLTAENAVPAETVYLGIKQLLANPADGLKRKFPPKAVVKGKIIEAGPNGVRFSLDDKTIAFSPASECDPQASYKPGDDAGGIVQGVNTQTFEILVSINKYDEIRDRKRMAQYLKAPPPLTLGQLLSPDKEE